MKRYLLTYSYIGSNFRGVQKQITLDDKLKQHTETVQGILEICLTRLKPLNNPTVVVSSRTDKGVHALETTAHVDLDHRDGDNPLWPEFMTSAMNRYFTRAKADIWIKNVKVVPETFHARYSARSRTYLYRLAVKKPDACQDVTSNYALSLPMGEWNRCCVIRNPNFDINKMKEAASHFPGLKDFRTFTGMISRQPENYSTIRNLKELTITPGKPLINPIYDSSSNLFHFWDIVLNAKSFVYKQVRRMVGVLIAVAQNKIEVEEVKHMIEDPQNNGWNPRAESVPAHGLFLIKVEYNPEDLILQSEKDPTNEKLENVTGEAL